MPPGTTKDRELPDEKCFYYWMELRSMTKVSFRLATEGFVNSQGHPFHYTSVTNAAYRYIMEHMDEARNAMLEHGYDLASDETEWREYVVRKAWTRWTAEPSKFVSWMYKNNLDIDFYGYVYPEYLAGIKKYQEQYLARRVN